MAVKQKADYILAYIKLPVLKTIIFTRLRPGFDFNLNLLKSTIVCVD